MVERKPADRLVIGLDGHPGTNRPDVGQDIEWVSTTPSIPVLPDVY
ncbi:MAG: hypothetical protein U0V70_21010 [Terriglobia bacterium]